MANIFDKEVEIKTIKVNDTIIRYNKETYPHFNYTCFVINCPKYLHTALRSRYGSKYGVDVSNDNHLKIENGEILTLYAHCLKIYVKEGQRIVQGQEIAEVGSTRK